MKSIVILGDAHLWPTLWQRLPRARGDAFVAAGQVFEYANAENLPVVASGDIFNYGQKGGVAECLKFLNQELPKLRSLHFIVGNHDLTGYTCGVMNAQWADVLNQEGHLTAEPVDVGGVSVAGIDYCHGRTEFLEKLAAVTSTPDILVIHQGLKEILGFEGAWEVECADLDGKAKVVVCGHTHVTWQKQLDNTLVVSPGSTIPWQMDEEIAKEFPVICFDDSGAPFVDWRPIRKRRQLSFFTAADAGQREDVLTALQEFEPDQSLPEDIQKPIFRIRYLEDPEFYGQLVEAAGGDVILDLVVDRVQLTGSINFGALEEAPEDADDITIATVKHTSPGLVRDVALEIQRTQDPEGVIEKTVREILEGDGADDKLATVEV